MARVDERDSAFEIGESTGNTKKDIPAPPEPDNQISGQESKVEERAHAR